MTHKKLTIDRNFNAPIDRVWEAFTTPEMLAKWWSPAGMTNYHASADVRQGGEFRYCFESSEGVKYWGKGVYQSIIEPTYLSYIDYFTDADGTPVPPSHYGIPGDEIIPTLVEFAFAEKGEKTSMRITGDNPFDASMTEEMTKSWNSMFDKLVDGLGSSR
jgi:uncharacterized protein YndB with AHSA1/START domain